MHYWYDYLYYWYDSLVSIHNVDATVVPSPVSLVAIHSIDITMPLSPITLESVHNIDLTMVQALSASFLFTILMLLHPSTVSLASIHDINDYYLAPGTICLVSIRGVDITVPSSPVSLVSIHNIDLIMALRPANLVSVHNISHGTVSYCIVPSCIVFPLYLIALHCIASYSIASYCILMLLWCQDMFLMTSLGISWCHLFEILWIACSEAETEEGR